MNGFDKNAPFLIVSMILYGICTKKVCWRA